MAEEDKYPLPKFHFKVTWGANTFAFTEVTGLEVETEIIEYRDGFSFDYTKKKMPGMQKYPNIVMKKGVFTSDNDFFIWWNKVKLNKIERRPVTISLLNEDHEPVMNWKIRNAWPTKVQSTDLKADGNEVAIETLELAHEGLSISIP